MHRSSIQHSNKPLSASAIIAAHDILRIDDEIPFAFDIPTISAGLLNQLGSAEFQSNLPAPRAWHPQSRPSRTFGDRRLLLAAAAPTGLHCDYCDRSGHTVQHCRQKQKARRSGRTSRGELAPPSQVQARVPWSRRTRRCSRCFDALLLPENITADQAREAHERVASRDLVRVEEELSGLRPSRTLEGDAVRDQTRHPT